MTEQTAAYTYRKFVIHGVKNKGHSGKGRVARKIN
jgi:hypothetical protein